MSTDSLRSRLKGLVPPIARRDVELADQRKQIRSLTRQLRRATSRTTDVEDRLADVRARLSALEESLDRPSFDRALVDLRRTVVSLRAVDPTMRHPLRQLPVKLANYRLGASHGISTPQVHAAWASVDEIDLANLPKEFVLKSDRGAGSHGVFPLRRQGPGTFAVINTDRVLDEDQLKDQLAGTRSLSGPFFAEELLTDPSTSGIPDDIKVYACYGEVGQVMLRRSDEHGNLRRTSWKFVDADGTDLGERVRAARMDHTIPVPPNLAEIIDASRHLSRAVGVPFVRVDVYATGRGIVLGELTRGPGGRLVNDPAHDAFLGTLLEDARWRLERDIMLGRPAGILHGPHPAPNHYPPGTARDRLVPPVVVDCNEWCRGAQD